MVSLSIQCRTIATGTVHDRTEERARKPRSVTVALNLCVRTNHNYLGKVIDSIIFHSKDATVFPPVGWGEIKENRVRAKWGSVYERWRILMAGAVNVLLSRLTDPGNQQTIAIFFLLFFCSELFEGPRGRNASAFCVRLALPREQRNEQQVLMRRRKIVMLHC